MPEGHISHRNALRFRASVVGHPVDRVEVPDPRLGHLRLPERLAGDTVAGAEALGKHHLLRFASGRTLHSHLMMNGVWRTLAPRVPPRRAGLALALHTAGGAAALYRCPHVRLLEPGAPLPEGLRRLGPDLLAEGTAAPDAGAATLAALAGADADRQVGDALMDQRVVAGIGNVYKSETCFLVGVDPWRTVGSLTREEAAALGETAARLLASGVADRGAIRTYRAPGAPPWTRERRWVYGRRGKPCRRCGTPIRSRGQGDANRTTYWCPTCQR